MCPSDQKKVVDTHPYHAIFALADQYMATTKNKKMNDLRKDAEFGASRINEHLSQHDGEEVAPAVRQITAYAVWNLYIGERLPQKEQQRHIEAAILAAYLAGRRDGALALRKAAVKEMDGSIKIGDLLGCARKESK